MQKISPFAPVTPARQSRNPIVMDADLRAECAAALRSAAERLGVDAYRLAGFLSEGRLADLLDALARPSRLGPSRILSMAEAYLEFLEREIEIREGRRPTGVRRPG